MAYLISSAIVYQTPLDLLPALGAVLFAISISCKRPFVARIWLAFNSLSWIIYDILLPSYGGMVMDGIIFVSAIVAMIRVDGLLRKKKENETC